LDFISEALVTVDLSKLASKAKRDGESRSELLAREVPDYNGRNKVA